MNTWFKVSLMVLMLMCSGSVYASVGGSISATDVELTTDVDGSHMLLINDGANEVFLVLNESGKTASLATTSEFELKSGESFLPESNRSFTSVSTICTSAETTTIRFIAWD